MRIKSIFKNSVMESLSYIIIAMIGLLKIKYIIAGLGSELNGYFQFLNQIITYIFLAEAGLSNAVVFKLYKPLANKDYSQVIKIFNGSKRIFRMIGYLILGITILSLPFIFFYVKDSSQMIELLLCYTLLIISQVLPFLCHTRSYTALLSSDQKRYRFSLTYNITRIITDVLIIVAVISFQSILAVVAVSVVIKIIEVFLINRIGKKEYPWLRESHIVEEDLSASKMSKDLVFHQVGTVLSNNVDSVIIMTFMGPVMVSIYASYNYISHFIKEFADKNNVMITNVFGNVFAKDGEKTSYHLFMEHQSFFTLFGLLVSFCFLLGARGFVSLWIGHDNYILSYFVVVCFSLGIFLNIFLKPISSIITATGLYKESRYYPIIEAVVNIGLSILFLNFWGIAGILVATCISSLLAIFLRGKLIRRLVFEKIEGFHLFRRALLIVTTFIGIAFLLWPCETFLFSHMGNYLLWGIWMVGIGLGIALLLCFLFYMIDPNGKSLFQKLRNYVTHLLRR